MYIKVLKEVLAWATDKRFWGFCFQNSYTTKELKNKAILSLKQHYALLCGSWFLVVHSNFFQWDHVTRYMFVLNTFITVSLHCIAIMIICDWI